MDRGAWTPHRSRKFAYLKFSKVVRPARSVSLHVRPLDRFIGRTSLNWTPVGEGNSKVTRCLMTAVTLWCYF